jgi:hypothetical protein
VILDQTKWYTIDYAILAVLEELQSEQRLGQIDNPLIQSESVNRSGERIEQNSLNQAIPEIRKDETKEE